VGQELPARPENSLRFELVNFRVGDQSSGQTTLCKAFLTRCDQLLDLVLISDNGHVISYVSWAGWIKISVLTRIRKRLLLIIQFKPLSVRIADPGVYPMVMIHRAPLSVRW
jgi:hypothetical protein